MDAFGEYGGAIVNQPLGLIGFSVEEVYPAVPDMVEIGGDIVNAEEGIKETSDRRQDQPPAYTIRSGEGGCPGGRIPEIDGDGNDQADDYAECDNHAQENATFA